MKPRELFKRYLIFCLGLAVTSLGVALATKGGLGNSPVASVPYSLSLVLPALTIGNWTILFNLLLVVLQPVLQGKAALRLELLLQMAVSVAFGYLIDLALLCMEGFTPGNYAARLGLLVLGCVAVGLGVYLEVAANVVMLPGDAFNRALAQVTGRSFGTIRTATDIAMMVIAALISLICLHKLAGVREGTLIAALAVGNLVKLFGRWLGSWERRVLPGNEKKG